jgi:hypothetical protein
MDVHPTKNVSIGIDPYPYIISFLYVAVETDASLPIRDLETLPHWAADSWNAASNWWKQHGKKKQARTFSFGGSSPNSMYWGDLRGWFHQTSSNFHSNFVWHGSSPAHWFREVTAGFTVEDLSDALPGQRAPWDDEAVRSSGTLRDVHQDQWGKSTNTTKCKCKRLFIGYLCIYIYIGYTYIYIYIYTSYNIIYIYNVIILYYTSSQKNLT